MTSTDSVSDPEGILYRLGRAPNPLSWPPLEHLGRGRFDDPQRQFRVLYASQQRPGVFIEALARFRPNPAALLEDAALEDADESTLPAGAVDPSWLRTRRLVAFKVQPGEQWLDLRRLGTREMLRARFARVLVELRLPDLDASAIIGPHRELTQAIAR